MSTDNKQSLPALTLAAIGVVYGDIGTSPLYTLRECLSGQFGFGVERDAVFGFLSLIFWLLIFTVSIKYITFVMRADNAGEGGILTLMSLAGRNTSARMTSVLVILGLIGGSFFYGEVVITPAISVMSAIEGLEIIAPQLDTWIVPISIIVLTLLFVIQKHGTGMVGKLFAPIMLIWFLLLAVLGARSIYANPEVLQALNPYWAVHFFLQYKTVSFIALGAVVLSITGVEALYADMGHFGKLPIRVAWFSVVLPSLVLNYFGQGALLLSQPEAVANPFFNLAPEWATLPLVCLATAAAVIASQALISGAFSVTKQVIQLGFLPRLQIQHTSVHDKGQIYMPFVNWGLFALIVLAVGMFRSSGNLAAAYGIAVTTDMLITTVLTFFVVRYAWKLPLLLCIGATGLFFTVDILFWSSNLLKLIHGGWFPLVIAGAVFLLMVTWRDGRALLTQALQDQALDLKDFLSALFIAPPTRVEGAAVFLTSRDGIVPNALLHNLKHNKVLHGQNLFVTVQNHEVPWIGMEKRLEAEALGNDCWRVIVNYGFKNDYDLPKALSLLREQGVDLNPMTTSYFLSRDIVTPTLGVGMALWREKLFAQMHHSASAAAEFLNLPNNAVVELGSKVEI